MALSENDMLDFLLFLFLAFALYCLVVGVYATQADDADVAFTWPIALARWLGKPATIIIFILTVALIAYQGALIMRLERQLAVCNDDTESFFP